MKTIHISRRKGFTLLELLVAISLMTMLSLFLGTVFSVCGSAMSRTRNAVEACTMANYAFNVMERDFLTAFRATDADFPMPFSGTSTRFATLNTLAPENSSEVPLIVTYSERELNNITYIFRKAERLDGDETGLEKERVFLVAGCFDGGGGVNEYLDANLNAIGSADTTPRFARICIAVDLNSDGKTQDPPNNQKDPVITRIFAIRRGE